MWSVYNYYVLHKVCKPFLNLTTSKLNQPEYLSCHVYTYASRPVLNKELGKKQLFCLNNLKTRKCK